MNVFRLFRGIALSAVLSLIPTLLQAQLVRSGTGTNAAAINGAVTSLRTDLGTLNANVGGSFGSGRREINWDGVPAAMSAPNMLTANFFNVNSPRGVIFSTSGSGFQVSSASTDAGVGQPAAADFGNIDASYSATFSPFSAQRLFTPLGSNVLTISFFIPGTNTPALTNGFGAVFSDVDVPNLTSIELFNAVNVSLGTFFVPATFGSETFSFLGISLASPLIASVRITLGNAILGAGMTDQNGDLRDLVVLDDFIYGEPVPEPSTIAFLVGGGMLAAFLRKRRLAARA